MGGEARQAEALKLFDDGRAAAARGDHALAVTKLTASIALIPAAAALAALGQSLARLARYAESVVYLAAAVGLGEATLAVRLRLAVSLAEAGDRPEGLRRLRDLWREVPDDREVHIELLRILSDPRALAGAVNRQHLLDDIRAVLPEVRIAESDSSLQALEKVGRYISAWAAAPADPRRLEQAFRFLDHLAENPDQEVADLLTAVVFPAFSGWSSPVDAARAMLGRRARRLLDDALALWGAPLAGDPPLSSEDLLDNIRTRLPGFDVPDGSSLTTGGALGQYYVAAVGAGASDTEIERMAQMLSRMADSADSAVRGAFADALEEMLRARSPEVLRAASRTFSGVASTALENLASRDELS